MKTLFCLLLTLISFSAVGQSSSNYFYKEAEVIVNASSGGQLSGTLTTPSSKDSNNLLAVIIAGSGPTDRDGNQYGSIYTNSYKFLGHELAEQGITTFRYDKRGVGASYAPGMTEMNLTFDNYTKDLEDLISFFRKNYHFKKIVLIGHSEGALLSFIVGPDTKVNAIVALTPPGMGIDSILLQQIQARMPSMVEASVKILTRLRQGQLVDSIPNELASIFRKSSQPFLISMMAHDPCTEIRKNTAPVLIVQGKSDLQISVGDGDKLLAAQPQAKLVSIKDMNHVLKISGSGIEKNQQLYRSPTTPVSGELITDIIVFFLNNGLISKKQ